MIEKGINIYGVTWRLRRLSLDFVWMLLLCMALSAVSCRNMPPPTAEEVANAEIDRLEDASGLFAASSLSDSLRIPGQKIMSGFAPGSYVWLRANRVLAGADFIDHNYDAVIERTGRELSGGSLENYLELLCSYRFTNARGLQYSRRYPEAIAMFRSCLDADSADLGARLRICRTDRSAMVQIMNTFQSWGRTSECVDFLKGIIDCPPPAVRDSCMRSLMVIYSYALSRTDDVEGALAVLDSALKMPSPVIPSPAERFREYAYAAAVTYTDPTRQAQTVECCEKSLQIADSLHFQTGVQWTRTMLGSIYRRTGMMDEAVELYMKGLDDAERIRDYKGEANACGALSDLYLYWKFYDDADTFADRAVALAESGHIDNPSVAGNIYMMKGRVKLAREQYDSAAVFWLKAEKYYHNLPYNSGTVDYDCEMGRMLAERGSGDTLAAGIRMLERVVEKSERLSRNRASACFSLGKALIGQGRTREGERLLDTMYVILNAPEPPVYLDEDAYKYALLHYLGTGHNNAEISKFSAAYLGEAEFRYDENIRRRVNESALVFQKEQKEQELRLANLKISHKQLQIRFFVLLVIFLVFIIVCAVLLLIFQQKYFKRRQKAADEQIRSMIDDLQEANRKGRDTERQLQEVVSDLEAHRQAEAFSPEVFRKQGESRFRECFSGMYPKFMAALRSRVSGLTPREELLCMLIVLGQSTSQIVDILCINHASVNVMRYRIRQKMGLPKDRSLEDELKSLV